MIIDIAFDRLSLRKGATVHIEAFARALGRAFGDVTLVTVADPLDAGTRAWPGVRHRPLPAAGAHVIERALAFRAEIARLLRHELLPRAERPPICHVRSIFEGYPLVRAREKGTVRLVFEANGLPSIELKYHHPAVAEDRELMRKLRAQEDALIRAADLVVTPSQVTAAHLAERGAVPSRLCVIPNGCDLDVFAYRPPRPAPHEPAQPFEVLYAGTLSAWQGVDVAMEAVRLCRRDFAARLVAVGPATGRRARVLMDRARELGLERDGFRWLDAAPPPVLASLHHDAHAVVAPLLPNDRNLVQGCCPLKVIDAMACGTPLVASDLPVVSALVRHEREALLVRPGSAKSLKDGLARLRADPALGARLSAAARARASAHFGWERAEAALIDAYARTFGLSPSVASTRASAADSARPS